MDQELIRRALEAYVRRCERRADICGHENDRRGLSGHREYRIAGKVESYWRNEANLAALELKRLLWKVSA